MEYKLVFTRLAEKDLSRIDKKQAIKILRKINTFFLTVNPLDKAKKLKGFDLDTYRYRVGDYRVVFRLDKKTGRLIVLVVLRIAHRKAVYRKEG